MRLLRVHAPGADPRVAAAVGDAVRSFNASLDIRLRFLSIGIEETVAEVRAAEDAATGVEDLVRRESPDLLLLLGGGEAAIAAASASLRSGVPVARAGAGVRTGAAADADRALDHLCGVLLAPGEAEASALRGEDVRAVVEIVGGSDDPAVGEKIVRALSRARRRERC